MDTKKLRVTQNFLKEPRLVRRLVDYAALEAGETVLEIGPGKGIITGELARAVGESGEVVAVELDAWLVGRLRQYFQDYSQVRDYKRGYFTL